MKSDNKSGTYVLDLRFADEEIVEPGEEILPVAVDRDRAFLYISSARDGQHDSLIGPHPRRAEVPRRPIEYLARIASSIDVLLRRGKPKRDKCVVARALSSFTGAEPVPGFKERDCSSSCPGHLVAFPTKVIHLAKDIAGRSGRDRERVAYHMVGHAVAAWAEGRTLMELTGAAPRSNSRTRGTTKYNYDFDTYARDNFDFIDAAGGEAESLWCHWLDSELVAETAVNDWNQLKSRMDLPPSLPEEDRKASSDWNLDYARRCARECLIAHWPDVERLAKYFLAASSTRLGAEELASSPECGYCHVRRHTRACCNRRPALGDARST